MKKKDAAGIKELFKLSDSFIWKNFKNTDENDKTK